MAPINTVIVVEHCLVAPPPSTVPEKSLPLTFFDLPWLHFPLIHHIIFHEYHHGTAHFKDTIIPKIKCSLSLALKHFFPLAGNLIFLPSNSSPPQLRYVHGDSISLTFAESSNDFNHLTGNHARDADQFYPLVPKLPPVSSSSNATLQAPLLAVQVTLFPNFGICVGFTFRRVTADGNGCTNFIRSFASISKFDGDEEMIACGSVPSYDRSMIIDPNFLEKILCTQVGKRNFEGSQPKYVPTNKFRATFVIGKDDVQRLKSLVKTQRPKLSHVSTFTITCAFVWACLVQSRATSGEEVAEDESEHFVVQADCRSLLDQPLPVNYFGNCLVNCIATVKTTQLIQKDGFSIAAEAIGEAIYKKLRSNEGVLNGAERWVSDFEALKPERIVGVAGSPKFAVYDMDFGWGKPKKSEVISIDTTGSISLNESRESKGNMEVGLSLPKIKMDAFAAIFADALKVP